jgi:hypothetical protein
MPKRKFALERGGPRRLQVQWGHRGLKVFLDGLEVPPSGRNDYRLHDGSWVHVDVDAEGAVDVLRDGQFLPGTRFDPFYQVLVASAIVLALAALHLALAFLPLAQWLPEAAGLPLKAIAWVCAILYALLGLAARQSSKAALMAAIALFSIEGFIFVIVTPAFSGRRLIFYGLLAVLAGLIQGIDGLREIEISEKGPAEQRG